MEIYNKLGSIRISVIIPVYNTEKYVGQCIDSILNQTFRDLEILIIDDGSTDSSLKICNGYAARDSRIIVLHQENGGISNARNAGIRMAKGEYIVFVDSDDYAEETLCEQLLAAIESEDAPYVTCSYALVEHGKVRERNIFREGTGDFITEFLRIPMSAFVWSGIYNNRIIQKYDVQFDETVHMWEDRQFNYRYAVHCHSIRGIPQVLYYWRRDNVDSITHIGIDNAELDDTLEKVELDKIQLCRLKGMDESKLHELHRNDLIKNKIDKIVNLYRRNAKGDDRKIRKAELKNILDSIMELGGCTDNIKENSVTIKILILIIRCKSIACVDILLIMSFYCRRKFSRLYVWMRTLLHGVTGTE